MSDSSPVSEGRAIIGICNPAAGGGRARRVVRAARSQFGDFDSAQWYETASVDEVRKVLSSAQVKPAAVVLAAGGDGTIHHIVQVLMAMAPEARPALAVLPAGSGNDFAFNSGLPREAEQVLAALQSGRTASIDVIRAHSADARTRWIVNSMGVNLTAQVAAATSSGSSYAYFAGVMKTLAAKLQTVQIKLQADGPTLTQDLLGLAIANGAREGGRFLIAPQARNDDGLLDYVYIEPVSRARLLRILPAALRGTHTELEGVHSGRAARLRVQFDRPCALHFDGEFVPPELAAQSWELTVEPGALRVVF